MLAMKGMHRSQRAVLSHRGRIGTFHANLPLAGYHVQKRQ
jgi:hypothetical protein